MYLLIKRGVYRHNLLGCWNDLNVAKREASDSIMAEPDHYHDVEIFEISPNTAGEKLIATLTYDRGEGLVKCS
jgi:hypothetical protein